MKLRHARMLALCLPLLGMASAAQAFIVNIGGGITPSMYLRVGDGSGGTLNGGGLGDGGPINLVSVAVPARSEEHTSELPSLMRISYAVFCLKKKIKQLPTHPTRTQLKLRYTQ